MASESEDQNFDETLKTLQMLATISSEPRPDAIRTTIGNPFQINPLPDENLRKNEATAKQIFGAHCECGAERMIVSNAAAASSSSTPNKGLTVGSKHGTTSLEHGIINPTPFKHKIKGEKKVIVRESILKNIGRCVHQNLAKQNALAKESSSLQQQSHQPSTSNTFHTATLKPSLSENNLAKCFNNEAHDDILDFRLLVAQCSELTLSSSSGGRLSDGPNFSHSSFKALRQQDFSGFQLNRSSTTARRNRKARHLKRYNSTSSLESDSSNSNTPFGGGPLSGSCSGTIGPTGQGTQQQQTSLTQQSPNASSSPSSSSSASCSTQARLNSTMPCDITIDEMASYFETLVHIPKKMSSMAEMMYI